MGRCVDGCTDEFGGSDGPRRVPPLFNPLFFSPEALRHIRTSPEIGGTYFHLLLCISQREKLNSGKDTIYNRVPEVLYAFVNLTCRIVVVMCVTK